MPLVANGAEICALHASRQSRAVILRAFSISSHHEKYIPKRSRVARRESQSRRRDTKVEGRTAGGRIQKGSGTETPDASAGLKQSGFLRFHPSTSKTTPETNDYGLAGSSASRGDTSRQPKKYAVFEKLVFEQLEAMVKSWQGDSRQTRPAGVGSFQDSKNQERRLKKAIVEAMRLANLKDITEEKANPLFYKLRETFVAEGITGLTQLLRYLFVRQVVNHDFSEEQTNKQRKIADLRYPIEWYPATRTMQRTIHLHVGPTNSGKTYQALQRLEAAETGFYAGPLRLLAHEVYTRFNAKGKVCALLTGEERRIPEGYDKIMSSCTVEMVPLNSKVDVAVIDEIQMLADGDRGWAWTQAVLGIQAKELHLCGEVRATQLVKNLCAATGDKLIIHNYERLSPLRTASQALGKIENLQKGDAIILFSRLAIHAMKRRIESVTGKRCAVVYGSLPPETRAQQAQLFNDPDNDYDFLVASDAIGMGLNLSIKRIVFEGLAKYDGTNHRNIEISEIKQIGGRAGRYKTVRDATLKSSQYPATQAAPIKSSKGESEEGLAVVKDSKPKPPIAQDSETVGTVTTLMNEELSLVRKAMESDAPPLKSAGLLPPVSVLVRFASYFPPSTPFSYMILRLHDLATTSKLFHMCRLKDQLAVADTIQRCKLTIFERAIFLAAPVSLRDKGFSFCLEEMAECVATKSNGHLLDLKSLKLELIDAPVPPNPIGSDAYLKEAEALHKAITLYLWLSYRFSGVFSSQALAFHVKTLVEKKIDECLDNIAYNPALAAKQAERRRRLLERQEAQSRDAVKEMLDVKGESTIADGEDGLTEASETLSSPNDLATDSELLESDASQLYPDDIDNIPAPESIVPEAPSGLNSQNLVNRGPLYENISPKAPEIGQS